MLTWQLATFSQLSTVQLYALMQLRQQVFVVEQNCPYLDADGKDLKTHHLMGYVGEELVAYARLLPKGVSYQEVSIGRVVTATAHRGQAYGKKLLIKSIESIELLFGAQPIRIGAQSYLKSFYESFDFEDTNEPYLEDGIPHLIMLRSV